MQAFYYLGRNTNVEFTSKGPTNNVDLLEGQGNTEHQSLSIKVEDAFFECLADDPKTAAFAAPDTAYGRKFYKFVHGPKTLHKRNTVNSCLLLFLSRTFYRRDGIPYQPNTVETRLKILFAAFARNGVAYKLSKDFNFPGGFGKKLQKAWEAQNKKDPSFGTRPTKHALPDDYDKIVRRAVKEGAMDVTGESNPYHLLALFGFVLGTQFGFRGVKEYENLKLWHIETGTYSKSDKSFPGLPYIEVTGAMVDKKNRLSIGNATLYDKNNKRRIVHNPNDVLSPYALFENLTKHIHASQEAVFCHDLSVKKHKVLCEFDDFGWKNVRYDPTRAMKAGTINKFSKTINRLCGIPEWDKYGNHDWRAFLLTKLANDPSVSVTERSSAAWTSASDSRGTTSGPATAKGTLMPGSYTVTMITRAVMVQMTTVSMNGSSSAT